MPSPRNQRRFRITVTRTVTRPALVGRGHDGHRTRRAPSLSCPSRRCEGFRLRRQAGCRLGDCLTDLTCLAFCDRITAFGALAFPAAGIGNVLVGVWLLRACARLRAADP